MKKILLAFVCLCLAQLSVGQIRLDSVPVGVDVEELLQAFFLADNMIPVGANFYGNWPNTRIFSNGEAIIGLDSGIFISTGNPDESLQDPDSLLSTDLPEMDLTSIIQQAYGLHEGQDAQVFAINFIPLGDSLSFDFVLASEHYEGLECLPDFDHLEVQLRSRDLVPQVRNLNIAHVPGKPSVPFNSNTVNSGEGITDDSVCSMLDPDFRANSQYFQGSHPELAFNGFTKVISTDPVEVIPYERYTLIISLSEGEDPGYDSGLFLGQGSFSSQIDWTAQYEIINTFFEFCDTLRVGDVVVTEEGAYFARITEPYSPIDTFYQFQAYKIREEVNLNYRICAGDTLDIAGNQVTSATTIEEFGVNAEGCDSITNHTVKWAFSSLDSIYYQYDLCIGDTLFILDTFLTETTVYQTNTNGGICDTTYFYIAQFDDLVERVETTFACPGDTLEILGNTVTQTTLLVDTLFSETACDTLLMHKVVFEEIEFYVDDLIFCPDDTVDIRYGEEFIALDAARVDAVDLDPYFLLYDGTGVVFESSLDIKGYGESTQVRDLGGVAEICLTIEHSWLFDLDISVTAPNGNRVILQNQQFIVQEHYLGEPVDEDGPGQEIPGIGYQYCWRMDASQTMTELAQAEPETITIPAGNYLPDGHFQVFQSAPVNGTWQLSIQDYWAVDNGFLFGWSIRFSQAPASAIVRQGWETLNSELSQDSISLVGVLSTGNHPLDYFVETEGGCYVDTTLIIQVKDRPSAPSQIDTVICEPGFVYDQWIESSGNYQVTFGPPEFCESVTSQLLVIIRDSIQPELSWTGDRDTYTFAIENLSDERVLIDFGDGQTSTESLVTHVYAEAGSYEPSARIFNACDTIVVSFQTVSVPGQYQVEGEIETAAWTGEVMGISAVLVSAVSPIVSYPEEVSMEDGSFLLMGFWENSSFSIKPSKNDDPTNGLDVADLIRLSRHINGTSLFPYPEQTLAADLDCDLQLTDQDISELRQFLLEPGKIFPDSCASWIFWPQNFDLPDTSSPFYHPMALSIDSIRADTTGLDFYGAKRGDIGGNASAARSYPTPDTLFLRLKNGFVAVDDTLQLDFRVENFKELVGFQAELKYDTSALEFQEVVIGEVPGMNEEHFGLSKIGEGIIRVVWLDILGNDHTLEDGALAFGVRFATKVDIEDRRDHIAIDSRQLSAVSFNVELVEGPVALKVDLLTGLETSNGLAFVLLQNRPNPFNEKTLIPFELPQASLASLRVYNQLGQLVWEKTARYPGGRTTEEIALSAPGLYYYQLETPWGRATRKMLYER